MIQPSDTVLFDFETETTTGQWLTGHEDAFESDSNSSFVVLDNKVGRFSGDITDECQGGFSSVRVNASNINLKDYAGLSVRVMGKGKTFQLGLRMTREFDGVYYRVEFPTSEENWLELSFPFDELVPVFRGQELLGAGTVTPSRIDQIGFFIADDQPGPFELLVDWVKAYR